MRQWQLTLHQLIEFIGAVLDDEDKDEDNGDGDDDDILCVLISVLSKLWY